MDERFDPYYKWLGIPPEEQPPNHYRLLGLTLFEKDQDAIESASDGRMTHLRTFQNGARGSLSQQLLNEVARARLVLLDTNKKAEYDEQLRDESLLSKTGEKSGVMASAQTKLRAKSEEVVIPFPDSNSTDSDPLGVENEIVELQRAVNVAPPNRIDARRKQARATVDSYSGVPKTSFSSVGSIIKFVGVIAFGLVLIAAGIAIWIAVQDGKLLELKSMGSATGNSFAETNKANKTKLQADSNQAKQDRDKVGKGKLRAVQPKDAKPESKKSKPDTPTKQTLVFDFSDEAFSKKHWEWNDPWQFASDGAKVGRGPKSFLKSRQEFSGALKIDMEFWFARAAFSNTGGCWITLWGKKLLITNGWRSLNAKIHIEVEENTIVYTYNGNTRRIEVAPEVIAKPTPILIRWRSRRAHFKRIKIKAEHVTSIVDK